MKKYIIAILLLICTQLSFSQETFQLSKDDITKGIVLFSLENCSRCKQTEAFFIKNNIKFKQISTSNNKKGNELMWQLIQKRAPQKVSVKFPVIVMDGFVSFDHKNLSSFLNTIKHPNKYR